MLLFACAPASSPTLSGTITINGNLVFGGSVIEGALVVSKATSSPTTINIPATQHLTIVSPAASLIGAAVTLVLPSAPQNGLRIEIATTALISQLSISAPGTTVMNAPTSLAAGAGMEYVYQTTSATWFRVR